MPPWRRLWKPLRSMVHLDETSRAGQAGQRRRLLPRSTPAIAILYDWPNATIPETSSGGTAHDHDSVL
ncbi:hypothetical protein DSL92_01310 [Billgrantia gudaonensis]|uniref:Uncharacterized protein n=1 Tax=Billgrantia gudaonensis TaxID=376427 RepID=A0A3S0QS74_9GAMM|nr:hypothetical protein DSL92_01310 [Halomonas gudaonensis]